VTGMNSVSIYRRGGNLSTTIEDIYGKDPTFTHRSDILSHDSSSMMWRVIMIDTDSISPNPSQPRKNFEGEAMARLADSIRCYGILQPITVRRRQCGKDTDGPILPRDVSDYEMSEHGMYEHEMYRHDMCGHELSGHELFNRGLSGHQMSGHQMTEHELCGHLIAENSVSGNSRNSREVGQALEYEEIYISDILYTTMKPNTEYELVAGGRRLAAARLAGLAQVPCIVIDADDRRSAELSIIENLQHETLNIFEQASAIASLIDMYSLTQEETAHRLSASQSYVANKLRILRLTEPERKLILENGLSERHARTLLRLKTPEERISALNVMIAGEMNVAASEQYIDNILKQHENARQSVKRKFVLKDIRLLYNTIDRAVETVRDTGINVSSVKRETEDSYELVIEVPKCSK